MISAITLITVYPNSVKPNDRMFVENRFKCRVAIEKVNAREIAEVPWLMLRHPRFSTYSRYASAPKEERCSESPVIASNGWVDPEVVQYHSAGLLLIEITSRSITEAGNELRANPPTRSTSLFYAEHFRCVETTEKQINVFSRILETHR